MELTIPMGTRGTAKEFEHTYSRRFLFKHGYKSYTTVGMLGVSSKLCSVNTQHGELIIKDNDTLTYLGHNKWDVRPEIN